MLDTVLCEFEVLGQLLPVIVDLINHFNTQFCEIIHSHLVTMEMVSNKFNNQKRPLTYYAHVDEDDTDGPKQIIMQEEIAHGGRYHVKQ